MFIRLIPNPPQSAVLFAVSFPDLPDSLIPPSWSDHIRALQQDELELPSTMHTLDKAVGLSGIIMEITFDVPALTISCKMVDGVVEEWPLMEQGCLAALDAVVADVNESAELDRELELENERKRSVSPTLIKGRHKKQRSLLMTLVASIIPSISLGSSRLPSPPPSPCTSTSASTSSLLSTPELSPSNHRRRARATLVDTCRRYVLSEITRRVPKGGYYPWIIQSLLRRTTQSLNEILQHGLVARRHQLQRTFDGDEHGDGDGAPGGPASVPPRPSCDYSYDPDKSAFFSITAASLPPTPEASDDEGDTETETDGSSLHTPPSSAVHVPLPLLSPVSTPTTSILVNTKQDPDPPAPAPAGRKRQHAHVSARPHHTPRPAPTPLPTKHQTQTQTPVLTLAPADHMVYTTLLHMHARLGELQEAERGRLRGVEEEEERRLAGLEERGRRRAWLNCQLGFGLLGRGACGDAGSGSSACGGGGGKGMGKGYGGVGAGEREREMVLPFRSSPLACGEPWGAGEWEYVGPVQMPAVVRGRGRAERVSVSVPVSFGKGEGFVEEAVEIEDEEGGRYHGGAGVGAGVGCDAAREYGEFDRVDMKFCRALGSGVGRGRRDRCASRLFPVSEEDVEDLLELGDSDVDEDAAGEWDVGHEDGDFGIDLEGGYGYGYEFGDHAHGRGGGGGAGYGYEDVYGDGDVYAFEADSREHGHVYGRERERGMRVTFEEVETLVRPNTNTGASAKRPPRVRTSSMYMSHPVDIGLGMAPLAVSSSPGLPASSGSGSEMACPASPKLAPKTVRGPIPTFTSPTPPTAPSASPAVIPPAVTPTPIPSPTFTAPAPTPAPAPISPDPQTQTQSQTRLTPASLLCQPLPLPPAHSKPKHHSGGGHARHPAVHILDGDRDRDPSPAPVPVSSSHPPGLSPYNLTHYAPSSPSLGLTPPARPHAPSPSHSHSRSRSPPQHQQVYAELDVSLNLNPTYTHTHNTNANANANAANGAPLAGGEFTLAMDLDLDTQHAHAHVHKDVVPFSVRVKRGIQVVRGAGLGVGVGGFPVWGRKGVGAGVERGRDWDWDWEKQDVGKDEGEGEGETELGLACR